MTPFITDLNMHLTKSKAEDENPAQKLTPLKAPSFCFPLTVGHHTCSGCPQHASGPLASGHKAGHTDHLQTQVSFNPASLYQKHSAWHRKDAYRAT